MATSSIFGTLVIVKRNGQDGSKFPLKTKKCVIGRGTDSDVRIQLPSVSKSHCEIEVMDDGQVILINLAKTNNTQLNGVVLTSSAPIGHCNLFTVADRSFRWEFPKNSPFYESSAMSNSTTSFSRKNSNPDGSNDEKSFTATIDKFSSPNNDAEITESSATPMKRVRPTKGQNERQLPSVSSKSSTKRRRRRSRVPKNKRVSLRKVSFGPNLSPEQFDHRMPVTTPIKNGGRPPARRPSMPDYYGNPILTPVITVSRNTSPGTKDDRSSPKELKANSKNTSFKENSKSSAEIKFKQKIVKPVSKSTSPKTGNLIRLPLKSGAITAPAKIRSKGIRRLLGLDNAVKIVAPSSLDRKKSAALRTIHAGKLKRSTKSSTPAGRRHSSPQKILKIQIPFKSKSPDQKMLKAGSSGSSPREGQSRSSPPSGSSLWSDARLSDGSRDLPTEKFVSTLSSVKVKRFSRQNEKTRRSMRANTSMNMSGMARLLETPSPSPRPTSDNILKSRTSNRSPIVDYTDVAGLKRLFKSPRKSPKSDYSDVHGLKRLLRTPAKSPEANYVDVRGVKRLLRGPHKSPKSEYINVFGLKRLLRSPQKSPKSDYSDVCGLKRLMRTPPAKSPQANYVDVDGMAELFKERGSTPSRSASKRSSSGSSEVDFIKKAKLSMEKLNESITPNSTPGLVDRSRRIKTPTGDATVLSPKLSKGGSPSKLTPCAGSPQATVALRLRCRSGKKLKTSNSTSPKIMARMLRSSARKKPKSPEASPKTPSLKKTTLPFVVRSSTRKTSRNQLVLAIPENSPRSRSQSKSPMQLAAASARKKLKGASKQQEEKIIVADSKSKRTPRARIAKKSLNMAKSPTKKTTMDDSMNGATTPVRKTPRTKNREKVSKTTEVKSPKSPLVDRLAQGRGGRSRRAVPVILPKLTPSPKLVPKRRTRKTTTTASVSPKKASPNVRILRRRAK